MNRFYWHLLFALEAHVFLFVLLKPDATVQSDDAPGQVIDLIQDEMPALEHPVLSATNPPTTVPISRHLAHAIRPAAAASVVAAPETYVPVPVNSSSIYPGGLTSPDGTSDHLVDALWIGSKIGDLSSPARLGGNKIWICRVDSVPGETAVRVRALVRSDGTAVRVEPYASQQTSSRILQAAEPCALREHYVAGRDKNGMPTEGWTLPFRIVIVGQL